jgi:hypothetical protein
MLKNSKKELKPEERSGILKAKVNSAVPQHAGREADLKTKYRHAFFDRARK